MKKAVTLFFLLFVLGACSSDEKQSEEDFSESFCDCFSRNFDKNFNERASLCNPNETNYSLGIDLIQQNLESCYSFYSEVVALQKREIISRAKNELASSFGKWKEINHQIINEQFDSLIIKCNEYLDVDSVNTEVMFLKGFGLENLGRYDDAIETYVRMNLITLSDKSDKSDISIIIAEVKKKRANNN